MLHSFPFFNLAPNAGAILRTKTGLFFRAGLALLFFSLGGSLSAGRESRAVPADDAGMLRQLEAGWSKPARTYKSHTRWWWPGNALTKEDITWQLEQMAAQGFGGVEIMSTWKMYEKGNHEFLSPEFLALLRHAVAEGKRLDLEVSITFGPGWSFGGSWVPPEDQSRVLCVAEIDLAAGTRFNGALPRPVFVPSPKHEAIPEDPGIIVAVLAARLKGEGSGSIDPSSVTILTPRIAAGTDRLDWRAPAEGRWKLMAYWLKPTGQECQAQSSEPPAMVIDHLNRDAILRYCNHLGDILDREVGADFGTTVDSFFCDSLEIHPLSNSIIWSYDTLARFKKYSGYDLTPLLPALWHDLGPVTPRVRYDVGAFLNELGRDVLLRTFDEWCAARKVQARIQPHYRFTTEIVQAAGSIARPETEVTTSRFATVPDPRKATISGARFYGRDFVSAEAYTFIHPARYRTDLGELKIATDAFLRDGVTQFYNHGYFASPEREVAPSRDMPWANRISHWNTWWPYYHHFADYVSRSCFLLRQGRFVGDVLIYSPQATAWSERGIWGRERRVMPYGDIAKTLVANGYDYDIVNDDLLQRVARIGDGGLDINGYFRRILILPGATVVPVETMRKIAEFSRAGGVVIALESTPAASAGLNNAEANDREVRALVHEVFAPTTHAARGEFLPDYAIDRKPFSSARMPYAPTPPLRDPQRHLLTILERTVPRDFALAGGTQSDGLTFIHRRDGGIDTYFVANLEPTGIRKEVTFRVPAGRRVERWDAMTGERRALPGLSAGEQGMTLGLDLAPWESAFYVFTPATVPVTATPPPFAETNASVATATFFATQAVTGPWNLSLKGRGIPAPAVTMNGISPGSWTDMPSTRHISGTGRYECEFDVRAESIDPHARVILDLGKVGNLADVELNGRSVGVAWLAPYRLDVTDALRAGRNRLVIRVTNTLINYVTGLKEPPEVPVELQARLGKANPAVYSQSNLAFQEMHETDLPPSGLIGPVQLGWVKR